MIAFILGFYESVPVFAGFLTGAIFCGVPIYAIGWLHGGEAAVHRVDALMRPKIDEAHGDGDVPELPQVREHRYVGRSS